MNEHFFSPRQCHLSVVATSRNDNHGENLLGRMQYFVNGFVEQCIRHQLHAELILVEWNPPLDTIPLAEVLNFPKEMGPCRVRIITVPLELHAQLKHADQLPLFQMIGKNVGIRRALGEYVLATNIDILFSDEIMEYLAKELRPGHLYRADRFDVPSQLPQNVGFDQILSFCSENAFRINGKYGTSVKVNGKWERPNKLLLKLLKLARSLTNRSSQEMQDMANVLRNSSHTTTIGNFFPKLKRYLISKIDEIYLHRNACGDFTLLSFKDWEHLRGYPEWALYSWHLDSVLLYQARANDIQEIDLPKKYSIYHIEHGLGSGYTPEGANELFKRLDKKGIAYLNDNALTKTALEMKTIKKKKGSVIYNDVSWGFGNVQLNEVTITSQAPIAASVHEHLSHAQ